MGEWRLGNRGECGLVLLSGLVGMGVRCRCRQKRVLDLAQGGKVGAGGALVDAQVELSDGGE